jgi:hypothetical protein
MRKPEGNDYFSSPVFFLDFENIRDSKQSITQIRNDIISTRIIGNFIIPK